MKPSDVLIHIPVGDQAKLEGELEAVLTETDRVHPLLRRILQSIRRHRERTENDPTSPVRRPE
jgi:hypothetical protein